MSFSALLKEKEANSLVTRVPVRTTSARRFLALQHDPCYSLSRLLFPDRQVFHALECLDY
jgi:hypothetical protein